MTIQTRKEILFHVQKRYKQANWNDKSKILDELILITGYRRKYAIGLLNRKEKKIITCRNENKPNKKKYDETIRQALITVWYAANQICSKRLAPFIPDLLIVLERFGHLSLPLDVSNRLSEISPATIDRLLNAKRREGKKGLSTTFSGSLLKKQIKIRTFADWNDVVPGFLEGDLVAHCGGRTDGPFLNTLVLTDIASTWTEFFPLLRRSQADVINALQVAQQVLPFLLLGLDTDNGSEFINYGLLDFCKTQKITFTRSRAYKKNDQAHVEERNGSIIRRIIGYDRYEGLDAYNALSQIYGVLRLYVNFFQPSLKLISKTRDGAKVTKKYDEAKTPYQRLVNSPNISEEIKEKLKKQYEELDPIELLKSLEKLQSNFWKHAWKSDQERITEISGEISNSVSLIDPKDADVYITNNHNIRCSKISATSNNKNNLVLDSKQETDSKSLPNIRAYNRTNKPRKQLDSRNWRTKPDPFEKVWDTIRLQLELNAQLTATELLENLIKENPEQFSMKHLRTMQRRVACWRTQQIKINQERNCKATFTQNNTVNNYISLIAHSVTNG